MNIAVIFAGGTGQRMNMQAKPKQFLEVYGKPIIIYTLEHFETHEQIDGIVVVCVEGWIDYCHELINRFGLKKVTAVIPGGATGMMSRYLGIKKAAEQYPGDTICLLHDGVRPLIDHEIISKNIESVRKYGSAVTVSPAIETIAMIDEEGKVGRIVDRSKCQLAKAPQSFRLSDLLEAHKSIVASGMEDCIDTAYLMQLVGHSINAVEGTPDNIKITTPTDFYTFKALLDMRVIGEL